MGAVARLPGLTTQTPGAQFEFSDFAFEAGLPPWPPAADVYAYLCAYAERFGVLERIEFGSEVLRVQPSDDGGWTVTAGRDSRFDHASTTRCAAAP